MTTRDLSPYTVTPTDTLRTAIEKIERNKIRCVVVVDEERRVLGTVSDGDIRRAYLHEHLQITPVSEIMQLNPYVTTATDPKLRHEQAVHDRVTLLPVVDDENRLLDIELAYEPFDEEES